MDRIETIYRAIDQMASVHGSTRPERFSDGMWNFNEEIEIWKKQIIGNEDDPLTTLQWTVIDSYISTKRSELGLCLFTDEASDQCVHKEDDGNCTGTCAREVKK